MIIPTVLVLPFPGQGHVNPMMILSQKLVDHGCRVIFVNSDFNHKRMMSSMVEQQHSLDESLLKLVSIPDGLGPDDDERNEPGKLLDAVFSTMPRTLEKLIEDIHMKGDHKIGFIVADLAMVWAFEVASKFGIKGAIFCPIAATMFALLCNIPKLVDDGIINSDGSLLTTKKTIQLSPNIPEIDPRLFFWLNMPAGKTDFMQCSRILNSIEWWLCNTAYELEPGVFNFVPKILPIGPLLRSYESTNATSRSLGQFWEEDLSCMNWLDQQPHCSVIYVAFGSITIFDQSQFNELSLGLDLTNIPFLWVVRQDNKMMFPNEFQGHKGKIVRWAPQEKVLSHPAIACFVSHCGWNSTVEGLSNGVPFLCWPYFSDQIYDKTYICNELNVGLGLNSNENGLVSREEIQKKLDQLISDENIRSRSLKLKENLMNNKGRSLENLNKFVKWLKE
uniref:Cytokinin-O-glucosyltransferase 2 n=2 Tax=Cajanus cajan TaxID=3821 RepID=A0A151RGL3_CAJCA|nr:Cytokinin-O-glucosyltransferase 2 [Cajanus cajan]